MITYKIMVTGEHGEVIACLWGLDEDDLREYLEARYGLREYVVEQVMQVAGEGKLTWKRLTAWERQAGG